MSAPTPTTTTRPAVKRIALFGAGAYGVELARIVSEHGAGLHDPIALGSVCDIDPARCRALVGGLGLTGVRAEASAQAVLDDPSIDAVWLPLPVHLHAEYAQRVLSAGKAVVIEKPAAGSVVEVDQMIAARDRAGLPAVVGYQEVYDPATYRLKQLLVGGGLGAVRGVSVRACWPRPLAYFSRNDWAGRRTHEGRPVHDSPLGNALAHFANLALFFAGDRVDTAARPTGVRARPYRCTPIENYDTVMVDTRSDSGVRLMMWLTHASSQAVEPVIRIRCDRGVVTRRTTGIVIERDHEEPEHWALTPRDPLPMLAALGAVLNGRVPADRVLATLELSRPHVELVEAVAACPVEDVPEHQQLRYESGDGAFVAVRGIEPWFERLEAEAVSAYDGGGSRDDSRWLRLPGEAAGR